MQPGGAPPQRHLLRGVGTPTEGDDVGHVDAAGDDKIEHRITEQPPGRLDGDRADPGDLAQLVALDRSPLERRDVRAQQGQEALVVALGWRALRCGGPRGPASG